MSLSAKTVVLFTIALLFSGASTADNPYGGINAIWYSNSSPDSVLNSQWVDSGQAKVEWRGVEPSDGNYDWSTLDTRIQQSTSRGLKTTIQLNGERKPDWLFNVVPYCTVKLSHQVGDPQGTLAYWHSRYRQEYLDVIAALAAHLKANYTEDQILAVRLSYLEVGTEHSLSGAGECGSAGGSWITPSGVTWEAFNESGYRDSVRLAYFNGLSSTGPGNPGFTTLLRNTSSYTGILANGLNNGIAGIFQTGLEIQPRFTGDEQGRYGVFEDYCINSNAKNCLAETWADSDGFRGANNSQRDYRGYPPVSWNYWSILAGLEKGVDWLGIYAEDIEYANAGNQEYIGAFDFARKYAGYADKPTESPGAWLAFREGKFNKGDYNFLASKTSDPDFTPRDRCGTNYVYKGSVTQTGQTCSPGTALVNANQRYDGWSRRLAANTSVSLTFNQDFINSLNGEDVNVNVVYGQTSGTGSWSLSCFGNTQTVNMTNTGNWATRSYTIPTPTTTGQNTCTLSTTGAAVDFHMVELLRTGVGTPSVPGGGTGGGGETPPPTAPGTGDPAFLSFNQGNALTENPGTVFFATDPGVNTNGVISLSVSDGLDVVEAVGFNDNADGGRSAWPDLSAIDTGDIAVTLIYDNPDYDSTVNDALSALSYFNLTTPTPAFSGDQYGSSGGVILRNTGGFGSASMTVSQELAAGVGDTIHIRYKFHDAGTNTPHGVQITTDTGQKLRATGTLGNLVIDQTETGSNHAIKQWNDGDTHWVELSMTATVADDYEFKVGPYIADIGAEVNLLRIQMWINRAPKSLVRTSTMFRPAEAPLPGDCSNLRSEDGTIISAGCEVSGEGAVYAVLTDSATAPSVAQITQGLDNTGAVVPSRTSTYSTGSGNVSFNNVNPNIVKYVHMVFESSPGLYSDVQTEVSAALAAPVPTKQIVFSAATNNRLYCFNPMAGTNLLFTGTVDVSIFNGDWLISNPQDIPTLLAVADDVSVTAGELTLTDNDLVYGSINALLTGAQGYNYVASNATSTCRWNNEFQVVEQ